MTFDIFSLLVVLGLAALGWRSGALRQVLRIVAIAAVVVGVPFLSPVIREIVFREQGWASPGVEVASMAISGILIYVVFAVAGWVAVKVMRLVSTTLSVADRSGGAAIGAVKGALAVYLFAMLLVMMEGPLVERDPDNRLAIRGGVITEFVAAHNVLAPWQFPDLERLHRALVVGAEARDGERFDVIRDDEHAAEFLRDERVEALIDDEELMDWVVDDHYPMTLADGRVREVLNDETLSQWLSDADWSGLHQAVDDGN